MGNQTFISIRPKRIVVD